MAREPGRDDSSRTIAAASPNGFDCPRGRAGCRLVVRPSGQVRPADLAPVTRNAGLPALKGPLVFAFRAPGFAPAVRALRFAPRPR
jgi:hypothetical protein